MAMLARDLDSIEPSVEDLLDHALGDVDLSWVDADEDELAVVADESLYDDISEEDQLSLDDFVSRCLDFTEAFCDMKFYKYQLPLARRIWETLVYGDGAELTVLCARQSGKSQTIANCIAAAMVLLPKMANLGLFPDYLGKFKRGLWVGVFGPVEDQGATIWGRVKTMLTSERAVELMLDPEIDDRVDKDKKGEKAKIISLKSSGSLCRLQTAAVRANIESKTYHLVVVDEAQDADGGKLTKSIYPMTTMTNGSKIISGTANREKSYFYTQIRLNRRRWNNRRGKHTRNNHIEWDWKAPARESKDYARAVKARIREIGEDSDEFQMAYCGEVSTPILTADLQYIRAGDVTPGMKLLAFDEERPAPGMHRQFREATVLAAKVLDLPCYEVRLSDGSTTVCSGDHQWLVLTGGRRTIWKRTDQLVGTDQLHRISDVWEQPPMEDGESWRALGYLAAAFDGEGCLAVVNGKLSHIEFAQKDNAMLAEVKLCLDRLGFGYKEYLAHDGVHRLKLSGGRNNLLRFLGLVRPQRLLDKFNIEQLRSIGRHDRTGEFTQPHVESVTFLGVRQVMAIKTDTRTYILNGLASHNCNKFLLEQGMFVTEESLTELFDPSMELVPAWWKHPVVVGIDPARRNDSTVVTVVWVDWDHVDPFGLHEHRVLDWLEIHNEKWPDQYAKIWNFLQNYNVAKIAVDANGVGSAVADHIEVLFGGRCEVHALESDAKSQNARWVYLQEVLQHKQLIIPGHSKARRVKRWRKFFEQMTSVVVNYRGGHMLVEAPEERDAHDDYVDSLCLAVWMTKDHSLPMVEVSSSPFYGR